jgi:tetratricopeptide (TPR) repeat protein
LCSQLIKIFPKNIEPCVLLAQIEVAEGRYSLAINALKKANKRNPKNTDVQVMEGDIYMQSNHPSKAEKSYQLALRSAPKNSMLLMRLAAALQMQPKKIDTAIALYQSAVTDNPNDANAHYNLGTALKRKHNFPATIAAYKKAAELSPGDIQLHASLGNLLYEIGDFEEAAVQLEKLLMMQPDVALTLDQLAHANKRLKRPEASLKAAERLVEVTQASPQGLRALAAAKIMSGDYASALKVCELGLDKRPKDRRLLSEKTVALSGNDERSSANSLFNIDELLAVTQIDPPDGYGTMAEFNQAIIKHVNHHANLDFSGVSHTCHLGSTSNDGVFVNPKGPLKYLSDQIHKAVTDYRKKINSIELDHPWMNHLPSISELAISGWVTKLSNQGYQTGHIHDTAWISGVYYVNLPSNRDKHAGSIEFGRAPYFYPDGDQGQIKIIDPREGTLVLFPSYFYHRTIPFESQHERITIAFDFRTDDFL